VRTLRTRPVPTRVVPDARHVAIGTGLDMAPEGRGSALHDGACSAAHMGGQGMGAFGLRIARAEDVLQGQGPHMVPQKNAWQTVYRFVLEALRTPSPPCAVSPTTY